MQQHIVIRFPGGFYPEIVHVEKGESIRFINLTSKPSWPAAGAHPTHSSYPAFDPKAGIAPWHSWAFTFTQEGAFTFHDHLAPEMSGIVISGPNDISLITDQGTCESISDPLQQGACMEIYFRNISKNVEYLQARSIYEDIAARYPNSCHGFAHDLGKNAYKAYLNNTLPEIGQEASSCAYGLWHGFTTAMQADQGFAAAKEFCATFTGATEEKQQINRMNCYHGIGIGLVPDPPDPRAWGDFQALVEPGLNFCDTVPGHPDYKLRCLTGVFHATTDYMINNSYGFTYNEEALANCAAQKPEHQYECFITLVSPLPRLTHNNVEQTVAILKKYSPTSDLFKEMFMNAAIMSVDTKDNVEEFGKFIEECATADAELRSICISAVINNLYANGLPGIEYLKVAEFCSGPWIQNTEQNSCFTEVISYARKMYTPERLAEVCGIIPEDHRDTMPECRI